MCIVVSGVSGLLAYMSHFLVPNKYKGLDQQDWSTVAYFWQKDYIKYTGPIGYLIQKFGQRLWSFQKI